MVNVSRVTFKLSNIMEMCREGRERERDANKLGPVCEFHGECTQDARHNFPIAIKNLCVSAEKPFVFVAAAATAAAAPPLMVIFRASREACIMQFRTRNLCRGRETIVM